MDDLQRTIQDGYLLMIRMNKWITKLRIDVTPRTMCFETLF